MRARKSKDKFTPWKKLDGNEFGIQNSMNLHVWFPISSGKETWQHAFTVTGPALLFLTTNKNLLVEILFLNTNVNRES
ncbi:hypothetical protein YC2023_065841 [Brassica napus]